ncbi:MAG: serine hydrolase [Patescibacteria group bacterium]
MKHIFNTNKIKILVTLSLSAWFPLGANAAIKTPVLNPGAQIYDRNDDEFASALVVDVTTGKRLYAYKPDIEWPAASLTKLMSALVITDRRPNWSRVVSIKPQDEVGGGRLRVASNASMSIQDLFYSSIVGSANNAIMALARLSGLGMDNFVSRMNKKAKAIGMNSSYFVEPSGMDPENTITAYDAVTMARAAFNTYAIRRAATTASYNFNIRNTSEVKKIINTNTLLTVDPDVWVLGGKTGFLYESRYNLIVKMRAYPIVTSKPALYVIVLGSPERDASFATAKSLANWAYKAYSWQLR